MGEAGERYREEAFPLEFVKGPETYTFYHCSPPHLLSDHPFHLQERKLKAFWDLHNKEQVIHLSPYPVSKHLVYSFTLQSFGERDHFLGDWRGGETCPLLSVSSYQQRGLNPDLSHFLSESSPPQCFSSSSGTFPFLPGAISALPPDMASSPFRSHWSGSSTFHPRPQPHAWQSPPTLLAPVCVFLGAENTTHLLSKNNPVHSSIEGNRLKNWLYC